MESTAQARNCVLGREVISRKLRRMALQVAEQNADEQELIIAGIAGNGEIVARCLVQELQKLSSIKTTYIRISLNKKDPLDASIDNAPSIEGRVVLLVDDVANTGKTMFYALKPFMEQYPKKIQTLVLVERSHKLFPIQTDFAGLSIATTLQEHIAVETEGETISGAWLY
jgi:pyrimidine operon attenuation protein/uracil phosphoribosyltransferase